MPIQALLQIVAPPKIKNLCLYSLLPKGGWGVLLSLVKTEMLETGRHSEFSGIHHSIERLLRLKVYFQLSVRCLFKRLCGGCICHRGH